MDSLTTLSKSISKVINKPSLRERFEHITSPQSVKESKYFSLVEILNLIDSQLLFLKQRVIINVYHREKVYFGLTFKKEFMILLKKTSVLDKFKKLNKYGQKVM
jgi:hypothetical protein